MKIKKIYIKNFKGIKNKEVIDFDKELTFLIGPYGFGKTTIFDVIEFCLTGELHRVIKNKDVTKDNKDYKKPFFQNTKGEDVILKLLLEKENKQLVIVKYFEDNSNNEIQNKETKNKVNNACFKTFTENANSFEEDKFNSDTAEKLTDDSINTFFELNKDEEIKKLYLLYNYLQQEETTFFLKKSEAERKEDLHFLFKTEDESKLKDKVKNFHENIKSLEIDLKNELVKKKKLFEIKKNNLKTEKKVEYFAFFDDDIILSDEENFDKENLYNGLSINDSNKLKTEYNFKSNELRHFLEKFDQNEYGKLAVKTKLNKIIEDNYFQKYFVLQKYFQNDEYDKLENINKLYESSKIKLNLDYIIFENLLKIDKFKEIEDKSLLYALVNNDDYIKYIIFENQVKNKELLKELEVKYQLNNFVGDNTKNIDYFLLNGFKDDLAHIGNEYNTYKNLLVNGKLLDSILLNNFYKKDELNNSKFDKLEDEYKKITFLKLFKTFTKIDDKVNKFEEVYDYLFLDDNVLIEFKLALIRKKELEKDLGSNEIIISSLNEIRSNLINLYKKDINEKIIYFDNKCLLCGSIAVSDILINNFKTFEDLVDLRTKEIGNITSGKSKKLDDVNITILNLINKLETYIDNYINSKESLESVNIYATLNGLLIGDDYINNIESIKGILKLIDEKDIFSITEINFDDFEARKKQLQNKLLELNIDGFNLYNEVNKIDFSTDYYLDFNILKDFLNEKDIKYVITKQGFDNINFSKIRETIINYIKEYIKGFDLNLYKYLKDLSNIEIIQEDVVKIKMFLGDNLSDYLYKFEFENFKLDLDRRIEKIKNYIKDNTSEYKLIFNELNLIKIQEENLNKNDLLSLKKFIKTNNLIITIDNIGLYTKDYSKGKREYFTRQILELLADQIGIFNEIKLLKVKYTDDNLKDNLILVNSLNINLLNDLCLIEYKDFSLLQNKCKILKESISEYTENIFINNEKLGGIYSQKFNDIFKGNLNLVVKYKQKVALLDIKQKYIGYKFYEASNKEVLAEGEKILKIENRISKLDMIKIESGKLKNIYESSIRNHLDKMIKKIETPFFIYSAKIIQNYQQGMGIFITFEGKKSIRFLLDGESNHDAIHHLSSGQLSVVSIAFTLAINKAFNISNELKFINIDDPIQEMDSLNIHSFIELIRHDFLDYSIIMSTHNDDNAYFMKYKIEKIKGNDTVKLINVQNEFFKTEELISQ